MDDNRVAHTVHHINGSDPSTAADQDAGNTVNAATAVDSTIAEVPSPETQDIKVSLQYLKDDPLYNSVKPLQITPNFLDDDNKTNVVLEGGPVESIKDVRGYNGDTNSDGDGERGACGNGNNTGHKPIFSLDDNGFSYVYAPTTFKQWGSQPLIAEKLLPEMEQLLKREVEGCDEIIFYDARIRQAGEEGVRVKGLSYNPFARQVHVDNTELSVLAKVRSLTEMKADFLFSGRTRIINIWRPIKHPVYDCGLAIADGGTLQAGDVIECDRHRQDTGEYWDTMGVVKFRPGFDWYYMSLQDEPNVLLFKQYDSATNVKARHCLHTAFDLPPESIPVNSPTRESIEIRALVFTYPVGANKPQLAAAPHPLAVDLACDNLTFVDLEKHSIAGHPRNDIDEGKEVKDAILVLRNRQIRASSLRFQKLNDDYRLALTKNEKLLTEIEALKAANQKQMEHITRVEMANDHLVRRLDFQRKLQAENDILVDQAHERAMYYRCRARSEPELGNAVTHAQVVKSGIEEQIQGLNAEVTQWKAEAMRAGSETISRCWQSSVDEAVRREREKDSLVVATLAHQLREKEQESLLIGYLADRVKELERQIGEYRNQ
jgi:hypothetical protein